MKVLFPLILASGIAHAECSPEQHKYVDSIEQIQHATLYKITRVCKEDMLFFGDNITLPIIGAIDKELNVAFCNKKLECNQMGRYPQESQDAFRKQYNEILIKKSV